MTPKLPIATVFTLALGALSSVAYAASSSYGAVLEASEWRVSEYSRLQCTLTHPIPNYGEIRFESQANRETNMRAVLEMKHLPEAYSVAQVYSVAPGWQARRAPQKIGTFSLYKQYDSELNKAMSWRLLSELRHGMTPTFVYQDWFSSHDQVQVQVSSVRFSERYTDFLDCVAQLLPYSFEDVAFTVLEFQEDGLELTRASQRKLARLQEYLGYDQDIKRIYVAAYTDAYGDEESNQKQTEQVSKNIQAQLLQVPQLNSELIEIASYGEMRHVAGNHNELERARNRRVVIEIEKSYDMQLLSYRD